MEAMAFIIILKKAVFDFIANMQNEQKRIVELYIPRKCSATNRLIGPKDHASVQIEIAQVSTVTVIDTAVSV